MENPDKRQLRIFRTQLPLKRPFQWRVFLLLVGLYFLGNLAGIPLLLKTNLPIEPVWFWGVVTLVSAAVIALSLAMANRVGLGAPLLEGTLSKGDRGAWLRSGLALTVWMLVLGFPFSLIANLDAERTTYPFGWELLPASFKAGTVEEIAHRFFLVSTFVWIGRIFSHDADGRPTRGVYWVSILLAGLAFGWAHVDSRLGHPGATFTSYALIMVLTSGLGIYFGWLFWRLGLEWAILAHFTFDLFTSMVLVPVYLLQIPLVWAIFLVGILLAAVLSWRLVAGSPSE